MREEHFPESRKKRSGVPARVLKHDRKKYYCHVQFEKSSGVTLELIYLFSNGKKARHAKCFEEQVSRFEQIDQNSFLAEVEDVS